MSEILLPKVPEVTKETFKKFEEVPSKNNDYQLWRLPTEEKLPVDVAAVLRVIHITDIALKTLMPDIAQKFSTLKHSRNFTDDPVHKRQAYLLSRREDLALSGLGWFRPIIVPSGDPDTASYDDYDLIECLTQTGRTAENYATAAVEIFGEHRSKLSVTDAINDAISDYSENGGAQLGGVCVRVGTHRAISMLESEKSGFSRISSEPTGSQGGIFVRDF